jgi:hypothetical protein
MHAMAQSRDICDVVEGHKHEGISPDTMMLIRSRKKAYPAQPDEDIWRDIYRLLFPEMISIPSPCKFENRLRIPALCS